MDEQNRTRGEDVAEGRATTTLEAMLAAEGEQYAAEARAMIALATFLRTDAIAELPAHSPVARAFVTHAKDFEMWADGPGAHRATWAALTLRNMVGDLPKDEEETS